MENFTEIRFYSDIKAIHFAWQPSTEMATDKDIKNVFAEYLEAIRMYAPKTLIADEREMKYVMDPDFHDWINQYIIPKMLKLGIERFAIIKSKEFFVNLSVEMTFDESSAKKDNKKFFSDLNSAKEWIRQKTL